MFKRAVSTDLEDNHQVLQFAYGQCVEMSKLHLFVDDIIIL